MSNNNNSANLGFESELWQAADALRSNMDAAEYKHVVLGLIFLKYISDAFEEQHAKLEADLDKGADPEDADEYRATNIFWVPKDARKLGNMIDRVHSEQTAQSGKLDKLIWANLEAIGYGD